MAVSKITGYKKIFGFDLPDWVNENMIRNFGVGLLGAAVMFLVLIFVIWPNQEVVRTRESELKTSKESLDVIKQSKEGLDRLKVDLPQEDQTRILAAMPESYSPEVAIFTLRRISADTGVSIISYSLPSGTLLDVEAVPKGANGEMVSFASFPVQITLAAPVDSLLKFISEVESTLPFGVVSDLNLQEITKLSRTANDKTVQLTLEIKYYIAAIRDVNINKLQAMTEEDLNVARELRNYNLLNISEEQPVSTISGEASGSGNIFGF